MSLPQWLVLKASAGSGKTYALVFHYLRLSLSVGSNESYYRHILAITFTNAAAAEMKERVIASLYALTKNETGKESQLFLDLCRDLKIDGDQLRLRAEATFNHMIHHYGQISIGTIDGFNHRLLRSFAFDLQLQQDFRVETELADFKRDLLHELFSEVGKDHTLTRYFLSFVFEKMEDEKNWDITSSLSKVIDLLFDEEAQKHLPLLEHLSLDDFQNSEKILRSIVYDFDTKVKSSVKSAVDIIRENDLSIDDFYYGNGAGLGKYILNLDQGGRDLPSKSRVIEALEKRKITGSKTSKEKKAIIEDHLDQFEECVVQSLELLTSKEAYQAALAELILKNIYELGLLQRMNHISDELRKKKNLVFVSDFQKVLHGVVENNPAPFIYEKIGERYHHILFDEFQDTSEMQWNNLLPLLENALSKNQFNLIVGDGKQAIYRWRNGKAGQFTQLPDLGPQHSYRQSLFTNAYRGEILPKNYRSAQNIIRFNNEFYSLSSQINSRAIATYIEHAQDPVKSEEGYVKVQFYEKPKKSKDISNEEEEESFDEIEGQLITEAILSCLADGFVHNDIAILTRRKGKDAGPIQEVLSKNNIPVITQESLLLSESPSVMIVVSFLKYLINSESNADAVLLLKLLHSLHPDKIKVDDFWRFSGKKIKTSLFSFLAEQFQTEEKAFSERLPLYESAEKIVKLLQLPFDDSLEILMDQLHQVESKKSLSLAAFQEWWDEKGSTLYQPGTGTHNAVRIMTIHASKGLQFPVVIVPMKSARSQEKSIWIDPSEENIPIQRAWVRYTKTPFPMQIPPEFVIEEELTQLDLLNLSYVATTRAESRLYILSDSKKNLIGEKLYSYCQNSNFAKKDPEIYEIGTPLKTALSDAKLISIETLHPVECISSTEFLVKQWSSIHSIEHTLNTFRSSRMGRELHETLAMFNEKAGREAVHSLITKYWPLMSVWMHEELTNQVVAIFNSSDIGQWFEPGATVFTEKEIIAPDGTIYRPDRVVIRNGTIGVIDFKTGNPQENHKDQIRQYKDAISSIYGTDVRGCIAYITDLELVEVD